MGRHQMLLCRFCLLGGYYPPFTHKICAKKSYGFRGGLLEIPELLVEILNYLRNTVVSRFFFQVFPPGAGEWVADWTSCEHQKEVINEDQNNSLIIQHGLNGHHDHHDDFDYNDID